MKVLSKRPETVKLLFPLVITGVLSELAFTPFIDVAKEDLYWECQEKCVSFWVRLNFHTSALGFGTWN